MRMATSYILPLEYVPAHPMDTCTVEVGPFVVQTKERTVMGDASPTLEFSLPFLSGKQLSVLTALTILQVR